MSGYVDSKESKKSPPATKAAPGAKHDMHGGPASCDASQSKSYHGGSNQIFNPPAAKGADGWRGAGHVKSGPLRLSGVKGAHRVGKK